VDGKVHVSSPSFLGPGEMVEAEIDKAWVHDLGGRQVEKR
jgi:hypothetical protein